VSGHSASTPNHLRRHARRVQRRRIRQAAGKTTTATARVGARRSCEDGAAATAPNQEGPVTGAEHVSYDVTGSAAEPTEAAHTHLAQRIAHSVGNPLGTSTPGVRGAR
jgi:hypothetical protein